MRTQIVYELFTSKLKLAALCSCAAETWKLLESGKLPEQPDASSVYVNVSPASGSPNGDRLPTGLPLGLFSSMLLLLSEMSVGGSLTFVIETVNCLSKWSEPLSVVRTQTVYELFVSKSKPAADCSLSLFPPVPIWNELLSGNGPPPQPVFSSVYVCVSAAS